MFADLPRLLGTKEPADLPSALQPCEKLENQKFRTNYANNSQTHLRKFEGPGTGPPLPRKSVQQFSNPGRQPFIPHLAYVPQTPRLTHYVPQQQYGRNYQKHYGNLPTLPPRPPAQSRNLGQSLWT